MFLSLRNFLNGGQSYKCNGYQSLTSIMALCISMTSNAPVGPTRLRDDLEKKAEKLFAKEQAWVMKDLMIVRNSNVFFYKL